MIKHAGGYKSNTKQERHTRENNSNINSDKNNDKKTNRLQENKTVTKILIMLGILKYIDDPYESPSQHLLVQRQQQKY